MRGNDLSAKQLQKLADSIRPKLEYLHRLKDRMDQKGFPPHDRLYRDVCLARDTMHELLMEIETLASYRGNRSC